MVISGVSTLRLRLNKRGHKPRLISWPRLWDKCWWIKRWLRGIVAPNGGWTMSVTDNGDLQMEFGLTLNIKSSTTFTQTSAENMVLNAFDGDGEKFAYITDLKNTNDAAFDNAIDVVVTVNGEGEQPTSNSSTPPSPSPVETTPDPPTIAPTRQPTVSIVVVEPATSAPTDGSSNHVAHYA